MFKLSAKIRQNSGGKTLRKKGLVPAILYGPGKENLSLEVDQKEFEQLYEKAGESSLISLEVQGKEHPTLIHDVQTNALDGSFIHVDFYEAPMTKEIETEVPLVFEGEAPAIRELGGTLIKNIQEIEVKALPQNLPHEIKVRVDGLETFEDSILVKDLVVGEKVEILREPDETIASVTPPEKVEEELEKPIEEGEVEEGVEKEAEEEEKEETKEEEEKTPEEK